MTDRSPGRTAMRVAMLLLGFILACESASAGIIAVMYIKEGDATQAELWVCLALLFGGVGLTVIDRHLRRGRSK